MGFSAAAVTVSTLTMITDLTKKSYRGAGMGIFDLANIGGYAGGILSAAVDGIKVAEALALAMMGDKKLD